MKIGLKVIFSSTIALSLASIIGYQFGSTRLRNRLLVSGDFFGYLNQINISSHQTNERALHSTKIATDTADVDNLGFTQTQNFNSSVLEMEAVEAPSAGGFSLNEGNACVRQFLQSYEQYCNKWLLPKSTNIPERWQKFLSPSINSTVLCPCIPKTLLGSLSLFTDRKRPPITVERSLRTGDASMTGGRWYPTHCVARHRIAIIIPYRNREAHLRQLVYGLHSFLQRQLLDYSIFVVEQMEPPVFNRASLLNVGYLESKTAGEFDCLIFHDVDMIPKDDRNFYTCSPKPRHMGRFRDTRFFKYPKYFGGVVAISPANFVRVNGFSNKYYGWGGEDDDFRSRVVAKKLKPSPHFPKCVAGYATPDHPRDRGNPTAKNKHQGRKLRPKHYKREGLSTTRHTVVRRDKFLLYTKISVNLPPP